MRIAETEKYPHVTYFFNGGVEVPFPGEDRKIIPSPKVATYDLKPEMSAPEVTDEVLAQMANYDLIILNFANPDMVGHTGVVAAGIKAVETIDECRRADCAKTLVVRRKSASSRPIMAIVSRCAIPMDRPTPPIPRIWSISFTSRMTRQIFECEDGILADVAPTILVSARLAEAEGNDRPQSSFVEI